jgi:hypothetical protein
MPIGLPVKANYAAGDILTATNMNDLSGTFNNLATSYGNGAGKNAVINGAFNVWQRGTSFTSPAIFSYTADRWQTVVNGTISGLVVSQQAFTAGTAPVSGYEGTFFIRQVTSSKSGSSVQALATRLEDVRLYAGQTVTLSFWAKADASRTWSSRLIQSFGSGGSADVSTTGSSLSVTTSWTRFTQTFTLPSIAGKTIGTGSYLYVVIDGQINTGQTMDIWGVQLEAGSIATPFQTASGGSIQGELAMCQRYYEKSYDLSTTPGASSTPGSIYLTQSSDGGNNSVYALRFKVEKRNASWASAYYTTAGTVGNWQYVRSGVGATNAAITTDLQSTSGARIYLNSGAAWTANTIQGHWVVDNEL